MKRLLLCALALCLCIAPSLAETMAEGEPLAGALYYPQGSGATNAGYVLSYRYPQFIGDEPATADINAYFAALAADTAAAGIAAAEDVGELPPQGSPSFYTALEYRVTLADDDYVSVLLTSSQFLGNSETVRWSAEVFARNGIYAGQGITLTQAMGLEQAEGELAEQTSFAAALIYELVWRIITQEQAMLTRAYFPDVTEQALRDAFDPEHDFYLDADGNLVFFIQSGALATELEGILTYPFALAELLSAAR